LGELTAAELMEITSVCRAFVENNYVELKKANPNFPFLIRECSGIEPRVFARYRKLTITMHLFARTILRYDEILYAMPIFDVHVRFSLTIFQGAQGNM
jgi:hypothetical protein